ncbi:thiamine pyrophosphate-dependent dehydrogenase E1 component subunit alpha [Tessaracoccus sp. MC1865]|uniref:thiamine pyrophosphate-dependent dehydrogenase E1 component subunit alpha n=1 Tax=Tessaracoccus sp. MC1865 TaxID=2760310 RepID=UPI0015FF73C0|nr:thiamine pyrophosphate-dependent dehydrogenase E1 component subunit alpha [Tessaracoccus sp. MC1865]MBB1482914.1 thiamine pyrophosphate-dependent dehydrogenase E1 component subunit alpha [Tessaracoccus sp. MC1865]QTO37647.1 thiamine pyrophosphate-dependent dehydrogenase E1 component subunit alpha [Tessaracoccus sp. MC1865]
MSTALDLRAALDDPLQRYRRMVEIRVAEDTVNELFASGAIHGTTHLCQGQEALDVGLASVLRADDAVTATYRGHGVALALGLPLESMFAEIMGKTTGSTGGVGGSMHLCLDEVGLLPTFAIVGAGLPVAAGAALAFKTKGEDRVAAAVFGDGASNIGAFHESLNLAAIWQLPVVFLLDHNVYGEYSRWDVTTPFEDLVRRAASYDMPGEQVDGMDVDAVRKVVGEAADRAREGGGPTLVEAKTYRFSGHSRSDTAPYRPEGELEEWRKRDPLTISRAALLDRGTGAADLDGVEVEAREAVQRAVQAATAAESPTSAAMFEHVWTEGGSHG